MRQCGPGLFEVGAAGRRAVTEAEVSMLDGVRISIGGPSGLVGRVLAPAAAIEAGRVCVSQDSVVPLR